MEQFFSLLTLQAQLALLMIIGIWFSKKGIINDQGRKCLTDLVIDIILPCNILQSFRIDLTLDMLRSALSILIVSIVLQLFYGVFCAAAYNHSSCTRKAVLQRPLAHARRDAVRNFARERRAFFHRIEQSRIGALVEILPHGRTPEYLLSEVVRRASFGNFHLDGRVIYGRIDHLESE